MSRWTRITNALGGARLDREIDEEIESHLREAAEHGRDPGEARRAFGSPLRQREASRDAKVSAWLDSVRADTVFALRQLRKKKAATAAAVLSLGLAIGACTTAFRLIDALIFRPLPIAQPERLYALGRRGVDPAGRPGIARNWAYPSFVLMRAAVKGDAELIAAAPPNPTDLTYRNQTETERAYVQYVSGWMFGQFGLQPAAGRVFTERDDERPGAHPYAVLSHDYWRRRFAGDPAIVGRTFRLSETVYEIVGVAAAPFTGTERGTVTDIFLPMMMHKAVT
ncbi:MAG: ABC transporter permease, partial [Candidatus Solibacter sp.]